MWRADHGARAFKTVSDGEASIAALHDQDLMDLHGILAEARTSVSGMLASRRMPCRKLTT